MNFRYYIILLLVVLAGTNSYSEALLSGSVTSVDYDSGFNALRNPALMSRQKKNSAGTFCSYSWNVYNEISGDVNIPLLSNTNIKASSEEKYNGTLSLSYVNRFDHSALGIAITKPEGAEQLTKSESRFSITGEYAPGPVYIKNDSIEEKKSSAISTVISWGGNLDRNQSAGLQFETGISSSTSTKKKTESGFSNKNYNMEISTERLICSLNCGYYYSDNNCSIGAIIKSGGFVREKQEYSYRNNLSPFDENQKKVSPYIFRNSGLEYILGFKYNFTNRFHFNMEVTTGSPFDNSKKELKDDDAGVMAEKKSRTFIRYSAGATGGFSFRYNRNLQLGFGGGAKTFSADTADDDRIKTGETDYIIYSLITGAEIKPAEDVNLLFGLSSYYYRSHMKSDTSSVSMKLEDTSVYINFIAGASVFY